MEEEKIINYISGQLSSEETKKVGEWIAEASDNKEKYFQLKNLWALTSLVNSNNNVDQKQVDLYLKELHQKKTHQLKTKVFKILRYAAIIIIAFWTGKYFYPQLPAENSSEMTYNEIAVPPGQMAQLTLSDGTVVYVNSCSKLKYPVTFNSQERKVFLSGEAYFSVTKNKHPFIVESGNHSIKVLGTKFNVMAYPGDNLFQTTLIEGKVSLYNKQKDKLVELKPNENYSFDSIQGTFKIEMVKTEIYDSWKDGIYIFDHETLGGITRRLERIFAVKISIRNEKIKNYKFTGTISRNVPFEQILKIIQISAPIKYQLKETHGAINDVILY